MIKLTYAQVRHSEFNPALKTLVQSRMAYKTAERVLAIVAAISEHQKASDDAWATLAEKYLEPVENSNPELMRAKSTLTDDEKVQAEETIKEFYATPVEIDQAPLTPDEVSQVEISPVELARIKNLICEG